MISAPIASDRLAIRSCRLFETGDLDDARERISGVMQPHRLLFHGRGARRRSHMDFLRLRGLGIGTIAFGQAVIDVPPLDDYHLLVFCLSGSALLRTEQGEIAIDRFNGIACASNRPLSGRFSPDCEQFIVRIDRERLATFSGRSDARLAPRVDLRSPRLQPWIATLRNLVTDAATVRLIQRDPRVAADYEQLLLRLLLSGQDWAEAGRERHDVRPASVHRAIAYLEAHATSAVTLADVAGAAGVPERTLYDAFRGFEGVSPMRYLRNLRLDRVRARLIAGGADASVTAIALGAGFSHLSRFAQDYAERFGERPSATLRRRDDGP
jgi:AraC-like DNA-binding protein